MEAVKQFHWELGSRDQHLNITKATVIKPKDVSDTMVQISIIITCYVLPTMNIQPPIILSVKSDVPPQQSSIPLPENHLPSANDIASVKEDMCTL